MNLKGYSDQLNLGARSTRMDDYQLYERQISEALNKYRKNRDRDLYKKINHELDMYLLFLDENFAAEQKYEWHKAQKKLLNELKRQKDDIQHQKASQPVIKGRKSLLEQPEKENVGMEYARLLEEQIKEELNRVQAGTQKAIEISTYIKLELNRQIEVLDDIYDQNVDMEHRLNRAKKGLIVILRRAMMNKLTRFLAILLVVALIGLIVVYVLQGQGVI